MARSFLLVLALLTTNLAGAVDQMFAPDGTLAHRVALETGISDDCASALLRVENEFARDALIKQVNRACREEVKDAIAAEKFSEQGADGGAVVLDPILGITLFVEDGDDDSDDDSLTVVGAVPGQYTGTGE